MIRQGFMLGYALKMIGKGYLWNVSKKQFRTVYYNVNTYG